MSKRWGDVERLESFGERIKYLVGKTTGNMAKFGRMCGFDEKKAGARINSYINGGADNPTADIIKKIVEACQKIEGFECVTADWLLFNKPKEPGVAEAQEPYALASKQDRELLKLLEDAAPKMKDAVITLLNGAKGTPYPARKEPEVLGIPEKRKYTPDISVPDLMIAYWEVEREAQTATVAGDIMEAKRCEKEQLVVIKLIEKKSGKDIKEVMASQSQKFA